MPPVTDPALLSELNGSGQAAGGPTIYRTPAKPLAQQRPAEVQGDALVNQQRQQSVAEGPLDYRKKSLEVQKAEEELAAGVAAKATEGERKNAAFVRRAIGANQVYNELGIGPRSFVGDKIQETTPGLLNQLPSSIGNSSNRQQADAAEKEFVSAVLRSDSGAAIPDNEIATAIELYFPQPGDGEAVIQQKKEARQRAIDGLISSAGRLADDATSGALTVDVPQSPQTGNPGERVEQNGVITGFYDQNGQFVPIDTGPNFDADGNPISADQLNSTADQMIGQFHAGVGDVAEGVGDTLGLVGNPLNTGINAVLGTDLSTDLGQTFRDATGAPENASPMAAAINQGGTAVLTGAGAATGLARAGVGAGNAAITALSQQPIQQGIAGAASGASGEAVRQAGGGPLAQGAASLAGGIGAFGASNALLRAAQPKTAGPLAQAAQRQGVELLPADAGGATTRRLSAAAAQGPLSAAPIVRQAQRTQSQIGDATARAGASQGAVRTDREAGELIRKGGDLFIKKTSERGAKLYDRAGEAAKGVTIKPKTAVSVIDENIARLSKLGGTNSAIINDLTVLKNDIAKGVDVAGLRDARTSLGGAVFNGKLRSSKEQKIYGDVLQALSDDISGGLQQAGRGNAAAMFKQADTFWRQRVEQIDEVLQPIMGKGKSGEDIISAVQSMSQGKKGGIQRLSRLMAELPKEQVGDIRATLIDRLGKASAGQQDETGQKFSASTFLTNWNKMSSEGKSVLFRGEDLRKNLDDIAATANASKEAQRYANSSNTAGGIAGQIILTGGAATGGIVPLLLASGTQFLSGKLLASPKFANWLAKAPANPAAQRQYSKKLSAIASAEPVIANDIKSVMSFLDDSFAASPTRAAAQDEPDSGREPPAN